jgi:hypothetical protein
MNRLGFEAVIALAGILMLADASSCRAQEDAAPPRPPYVADVPDFYQWTITVTPTLPPTNATQAPATPSVAPDPMSITKVVYTHTKSITRDEFFYQNGRHGEYWLVGNHVLIAGPNGDVSIETAGTMEVAGLVPDLACAGFFGVDWIHGSNFQAWKALDDGTKVCLYKGKLTSINTGAAFAAMSGVGGGQIPMETVPAEAAIAGESRLPLVIKEPLRTLTYSYQAVPTEMLQVPSYMQKRLQAQQERDDYINRMNAAQSR